MKLLERKATMENSKGFVHIMTQINATGRQKMEGYWQDALECIYDWERETIEDIIWNNFDSDSMLAQFLPRLQKYDGIEKLRKSLTKYSIPCDASVEIAQVLYAETEDEQYLDVIIENIKKAKVKYSYLAILGRCKPNKKAESFLRDVIIESENDLERNTAATALLQYLGIIHDLNNMSEYIANMDLVKAITNENKEARIEALNKLDNA